VYIRPLLDISKSEILAHLSHHEIAFATDTSNSDTIYDRNRIRHNILPEFEQINTKYRHHISQLSRYAQEYGGFLEDTFIEQFEMGEFHTSWYTQLHDFMKKEWIHFIYKKTNL